MSRRDAWYNKPVGVAATVDNSYTTRILVVAGPAARYAASSYHC